MIRIILVFIVGSLFPSWNAQEITDTYWKTSQAIAFWNDYGVMFAAPELKVIGAPLDAMTWTQAYQTTDQWQSERETIYLVLRPENWRHEGYARPNYITVGYRQPYPTYDGWDAFTAMTAHELGHSLGASDKYECDNDGRNCTCNNGYPDLMCNLAYRKANQQTLDEIMR